jgi:hypothetical protein
MQNLKALKNVVAKAIQTLGYPSHHPDSGFRAIEGVLSNLKLLTWYEHSSYLEYQHFQSKRAAVTFFCLFL